MTNTPTVGALIYAKDLERVAGFYRRLLALSVVHAELDRVVLGSGGFELIIHAIPADIASTIRITTPPAVRQETPIKLLLPIDDLAQARSMATQLGGHLASADREWQLANVRVCDGHDPEGNVFQLRQAVP
jgi:predicted enzyme related to lactoylglutathione lyase